MDRVTDAAAGRLWKAHNGRVQSLGLQFPTRGARYRRTAVWCGAEHRGAVCSGLSDWHDVDVRQVGLRAKRTDVFDRARAGLLRHVRRNGHVLALHAARVWRCDSGSARYRQVATDVRSLALAPYRWCGGEDLRV